MENTVKTRRIDDWVINFRAPAGDGPHPVMLLLHGWTGDENVMWIFTPRLDPRYLILAPRGLYPAPQGGYGWHPHQDASWPRVEDFRPATAALLDLLSPRNFPNADFSRLNAMGFSQGAALTYTLALENPERVRALAGLAGFLPEDAESLAQSRPLAGKPVFVAHGTRDERVPVERARQAVEFLQQAGALVSYCEEDVGHKLSAACFRAMENFFEKNFPD
jgi:phospholipase/carboxylesterase